MQLGNINNSHGTRVFLPKGSSSLLMAKLARLLCPQTACGVKLPEYNLRGLDFIYKKTGIRGLFLGGFEFRKFVSFGYWSQLQYSLGAVKKMLCFLSVAYFR